MLSQGRYPKMFKCICIAAKTIFIINNKIKKSANVAKMTRDILRIETTRFKFLYWDF